MRRDRPFTLVAELTYRCPLRCPYCSNPTDCGSARYRDELTTADWRRIFRESRALGVVQAGLSGGEPLLRRDLEEVVAAARAAGLYSTLVTAGTLFHHDRAAGLRAAGLDHVQISFQDSRPQESDRIAGTPCFQQKFHAAALAKELDFPLTVNVVLHRQNLDRIEEIIALAEAVQADRLELANAQYYGWALANRAALLPTRKQLERAERAVLAARARLGRRMQVLYVLPDYYEDYPKPCMGGWGRRTIVVTPNGDVLPCQAAGSLPQLEFPNARHQPLDWIWHESDVFNRFYGTDWMNEPCRSCPRREIDYGGCRCQAFLLTGDAAAADPVCHLSPHHSVVVEARGGAQTRAGGALIYRSAIRGARP